MATQYLIQPPAKTPFSSKPSLFASICKDSFVNHCIKMPVALYVTFPLFARFLKVSRFCAEAQRALQNKLRVAQNAMFAKRAASGQECATAHSKRDIRDQNELLPCSRRLLPLFTHVYGMAHTCMGV